MLGSQRRRSARTKESPGPRRYCRTGAAIAAVDDPSFEHHAAEARSWSATQRLQHDRTKAHPTESPLFVAVKQRRNKRILPRSRA